MTRISASWLRSFALLALLPATMANKGGCAPSDVDMGTDGEVGGDPSSNANPDDGKGGAAATLPKGGASSVASVSATTDGVAKGGDSNQASAKGGASNQPSGKGGDSNQAGGKGGDPNQPSGKGGAADDSTYIKCPESQWCSGDQPEREACPNGSLPNVECFGTPSGACEWKVMPCLASASCSKAMCGDESQVAPCEGDIGAVVCEPNASGVCEWQRRCSDPPQCRAKCGAEPTERGTCPDGSLKEVYCLFEGAENEKYLPCSDTEHPAKWVEQPCATTIECNGVDEVNITTSMAPPLENSNFAADPAAYQELCRQAFRQPAIAWGDFYCIYEQYTLAYNLLFIDHEGQQGALGLQATVFPRGECGQMTTRAGAETTLRTPTQAFWDQLNEVVGVNLQELK